MQLLERDTQLKVLKSAQTQAKSGQGCVALVYGEAGIGKTSLIEHFIKENGDSWRVLRGACDSLFTPRPLGPLHDIALHTQGQLPQLLEAESNRTAIFSACLNELFEEATILVIEDIHWADEVTLDLLKYLGRRIGQTNSMMILTYRDDELAVDHPLRILLGDLASSHTTHRISVIPLSKNGVHELAKEKNIDESELHRLTNGNPFYVTEVLAVKGGIPETVRDAVLARAARLSKSARNLLEAAAVIGSKVEPWLLSQISGADSSSIDECISVGMLQSQGEHYAFRHELARQTILDSILEQRKIELHRLTLKALKESPETKDDLAWLANHAEGAKDADAVLEYARAAGRQASALGAHRQASAHYQAALQYASQMSPEKHAELLDDYAEECDLTNQMTRAIHTQKEALRLWRELGKGEKEGRALRRLSEIVMQQNKKTEMDRYILESISVLEKSPPAKELARAYSHKARIHMVAYEVEETYKWGNRAMELAEQLDDIETLIHVLNNMGSVEMWHIEPAEGQKKLERSLQLSLAHDYHDHAARAYNNLIDGLLCSRDYKKCMVFANEGLDYCRRHDLDNWYTWISSFRAQANFERGRWAETEKELHAAQKVPVTVEMRTNVDFLLKKLKIRRGDPLLQNDVDDLRKMAKEAVFHEVLYPIAELFAELAWLQDDLEKCRVEAEPMFQTACELNLSPYIGRLAYWMWRTGAITSHPPNTIEPYATQISGDWRAAASMWEQYGCPYEQGMALMDGDEAAQLQALVIFENLGARPIIEKLKRQMEAQGIRIPRGPRPATRENPFGLTPREMEVLEQLVRGASNNDIAEKLILSTRTVEHHISSILRKMQVQSRNEAASLAQKDDLFQSQ